MLAKLQTKRTGILSKRLRETLGGERFEVLAGLLTASVRETRELFETRLRSLGDEKRAYLVS